MAEIYVSVDVETTGPVPGLYSMISLGAAIFNEKGEQLSTFSGNLFELEGASRCRETMENFWELWPQAWEAATKDAKNPQYVMSAFKDWVRAHGGKPVFVAYPATFDSAFVRYYLVRFTGDDSPFGFSALDLKSYAMAILGKKFEKTVKKHMPVEWFNPETMHTHVTVEDAIEQGQLFFQMRDWHENRRKTLISTLEEFHFRLVNQSKKLKGS